MIDQLIDWSVISFLAFFLSSFPSPFYFYLRARWNHSDFALPWAPHTTLAISFLSLSLLSKICHFLTTCVICSLNPLCSGFWSCVSPEHHLWVHSLLPGQRFFSLMFVLPCCSGQLPAPYHLCREGTCTQVDFLLWKISNIFNIGSI